MRIALEVVFFSEDIESNGTFIKSESGVKRLCDKILITRSVESVFRPFIEKNIFMNNLLVISKSLACESH